MPQSLRAIGWAFSPEGIRISGHRLLSEVRSRFGIDSLSEKDVSFLFLFFDSTMYCRST
jgi:hypothetical protein